VEGRGGIFDVTIDGELAYSKRLTRKFPSAAQIVALMDARRRNPTDAT
jgi:predicted Rdx family selenoprotein